MTPWEQHVRDWENCQRCPLSKQRNKIVLGRGSLPADVVFIGEAPGQSEDISGLPFDGPAGHLLDRIIAEGLPSQLSYALTNLVACFPRVAKQTDNHEPEPEEIEECSPRLIEFIRIARPRLIVMVGELAETWTPRVTAMMEKEREDKAVQWCSIDHPAHLLRLRTKSPARYPLAYRRAVVTLMDAGATLLAADQIPF